MDEIYYTTVQGDTFDSIALEYYSDEKKASTIIDANSEYSDVLIFDAGVVLAIPIIEEDGETPASAPPWRA